jgi:hypothetical protein
MRRLFKLLRENEGIAIIAVTVILIVAAMMGGTIVSQTMQDIQLTERTFEDKQALYIAESAKEQAYTLVNSAGLTGMTGEIAFFQDPDLGMTTSKTISNQQMPGGGMYEITVDDLNPAATIFDPKFIQITATGNSGFGRSRRITVVAEVDRENISPFANAIFGGGGQAGGVINGNSQIHGSVHLLGDNVVDGNNSIEATVDLSGSSLIHNNYGVIDSSTGMSAQLFARVAPMPVEDGLDTLHAKLRVRNGAVGISGSSEIGTDPTNPNRTPPGTKGSMDGIYIETDSADERWTGTATSGDPAVPDPSQVFSDNGTNGMYDLDPTLVTMPKTNGEHKDENGVSYETYDGYFTTHSWVQLPSLTLDTTCSAATAVQTTFAGNDPLTSGIDVTVTGCSFVIKQLDLSSSDPINAPPLNTFAFSANATTKTANLTMSGMIEIDGDLVIGEKNKLEHVNYDGRATLYVRGDGTGTVEDGTANGNITVHSDLLPVGTFPTDDVIGLVARNNMTLAEAGDANLKLAGAFYAGNEIVSSKQNEVAGTFVSNYFNMGGQVPKIFQVPILVTNLPPGMIGAYPIWAITGFEEKGWQADFPTDGTV